MRTRVSSRSPTWHGSLARGLLLALVGIAGAAAGACYDGPGELEPEPGAPGGLCIEPAGTCDQPFWPCEPVRRFCYDAANPCRGVLCGGHGTCSVGAETGLPECTCEVGYSNAEYSLYCL